MEIKINTEETELEELKQSLDIIKRAINRRDNAFQTELPKEILQSIPQEETKEPEKYEEPKMEQLEQPRMIEQPKPVVQPMQIAPPKRTPPPTVDMSALTMSDRGRRSAPSMGSSSSFSQPSFQQPRINEKDAVVEIINNLKRKNPDGPLYMQNIVSLANSRGISEERARKLVSELKDSGSI